MGRGVGEPMTRGLDGDFNCPDVLASHPSPSRQLDGGLGLLVLQSQQNPKLPENDLKGKGPAWLAASSGPA